MGKGLRKFALTAHVACSIGWLGAVAGFLSLAVAGLVSSDAHLVRAAYPAMELIARSVIVPLAVAALVTGLVQSLGTHWGLFRHYWVLIKFLVTMFAAVVLLLQLEPISHLADVARTASFTSRHDEARTSLVVHAAGGLLVLLVPTVLSVYKPRGLTRHGRRKRVEDPAD